MTVVMVTITTAELSEERRCHWRLPVGTQQRGQIIFRGHRRQATEDITEIGEGIFAMPLAGDDERVNDSGALAGLGVADEQSVLFSDGRGLDGIFDEVVVELGAAVLEVSGGGQKYVDGKNTSGLDSSQIDSGPPRNAR